MAKSSFYSSGSSLEELANIAEGVQANADAAASSAASAEASATSAENSAASAAASELASAASETAAAASELSAASSASSAVSAFDSFDDRYLGAFVSAPTEDNDGDPLIVGALYWSTPQGEMFSWNGSSWAPLVEHNIAVVALLDGNGSPLGTGEKGDIQVPFDCTINAVTLLADVSGSVVLDIWKAPYASYPPTVANTITASAKPTLSSADKSTDSTLTGWTTSVSAGDVLRFKIDSVSTITRLTVSLSVTK
jgi:hypothetical protein